MLSKDFKEFVALLNAHEVKFLVVGGYAMAVHGRPRQTGDLDIWLRNDHGNAQRVMAALNDFGFGKLGLSPADFEKIDQVVQLGDLTIPFIGLDSLKANKRANGSPPRHRRSGMPVVTPSRQNSIRPVTPTVSFLKKSRPTVRSHSALIVMPREP